jgi:hypothetical protein
LPESPIFWPRCFTTLASRPCKWRAQE